MDISVNIPHKRFRSQPCIHTDAGRVSQNFDIGTNSYFIKDRHGVSAYAQVHSHTFNNPVIIDMI